MLCAKRYGPIGNSSKKPEFPGKASAGVSLILLSLPDFTEPIRGLCVAPGLCSIIAGYVDDLPAGYARHSPGARGRAERLMHLGAVDP